MVKAPISGYWAATANDRMDIDDPVYFAWVVARYTARGISTVFLMGLYLKVDTRSLPQKNRDVVINHFLVPVVMLAILGTFLESLIDQYVGPLDSRLRLVLMMAIYYFLLVYSYFSRYHWIFVDVSARLLLLLSPSLSSFSP